MTASVPTGAGGRARWTIILLWLLAGAVGALLIALNQPATYGAIESRLTLDAADVRAIALERLDAIAPLPDDPYVVVFHSHDEALELRLLRMMRADQTPPETLRTLVSRWMVRVYPVGAQATQRSHDAWISHTGEILRLRHYPASGIDSEGSGEGGLDDDDARRRARNHLDAEGIDLDQLQADIEVRRQSRGDRLETEARFRWHRTTADADALDHGISVYFSDDQLIGHAAWYDDPQAREIGNLMQPLRSSNLLFIFLPGFSSESLGRFALMTFKIT
ncbi:MAG: hypothetical protein AAF772_09100 [Acidobacteriota bacterium]